MTLPSLMPLARPALQVARKCMKANSVLSTVRKLRAILFRYTASADARLAAEHGPFAKPISVTPFFLPAHRSSSF